MENVNVNSVDRFFVFEVLLYDFIDQGVGDGGERQPDGGWSIREMGFESFGEVRGERRGGEGDV